MPKVWVELEELQSLRDRVRSYIDGLQDIRRTEVDARMLEQRLQIIIETHQEKPVRQPGPPPLAHATTVRDIDKTPPRPYSSGELEAARPSVAVRSGETHPQPFKVENVTTRVRTPGERMGYDPQAHRIPGLPKPDPKK